MKCGSKYADCKENENEAQRKQEYLKQKCDANSMSFKWTNDKVKCEEVSKEDFHLEGKSNVSHMSKISNSEFYSSVFSLLDKKADFSIDDLFSASKVNVSTQAQVVENNYEVVLTNKTTETVTQTSHNFEFTENNNEQETKNVDNSTQTDGNETLVNCNQVRSKISSVMNMSASYSDETVTYLHILSEQRKDVDKIFEEKK